MNGLSGSSPSAGPNASEAEQTQTSPSDRDGKERKVFVPTWTSALLARALEFNHFHSRSTHVLGYCNYIAGTIPTTLFAASGDKGLLEQALPLLRSAASLLDRGRFPEAFAQSHIHLAEALMHMPEGQSVSSFNEYEACVALERVFLVWTPVSHFDRWVATKFKLASAAASYGDVSWEQRIYREIAFACDGRKNQADMALAQAVYAFSLVRNAEKTEAPHRTYKAARDVLAKVRLPTLSQAFDLTEFKASFIVANCYHLLFAKTPELDDAEHFQRCIVALERAYDGYPAPRRAIRSLRIQFDLLRSAYESDQSGLAEGQADLSSLKSETSQASASGAGSPENQSSTENLLQGGILLEKALLNHSVIDAARAAAHFILGHEMSSTPTEVALADASLASLRRLIQEGKWSVSSTYESAGFAATTGKKLYALADAAMRESRPEDAIVYAKQLANVDIEANSQVPGIPEASKRIELLQDGVFSRLIEGRVTGDAAHFAIAINELDRLAANLAPEAAPILWIENKLTALEAHRLWMTAEWSDTKFREAQLLMVQVNEFSWEKHPYHYIEATRIWAETCCLFVSSEKFLSTNFNEPHNEYVDAYISVISQRLDVGLSIFLETEVEEQKAPLSHQLALIGDSLSLLYAIRGSLKEAVFACSQGRAISASTSFFDSQLNPEQAADIRRARIQWRKVTAEEQQRASEMIGAIDSKSDDVLEIARSLQHIGNNSTNAFSEYRLKLDELPIKDLLSLSWSDLRSSLPENVIVVTATVTRSSSFLIVFDHSTEELDESNLHFLPDLTSDSLEDLLLGTDSWFECYNHFRGAAVREDITEEALASELQTWNDRVDEICDTLGHVLMQPLHELIRSKYPKQTCPEIRLVVPGQLSILPLGAAMISEQGNEKRKRFIQTAAISFWPSLFSMANRGSPSSKRPDSRGPVVLVTPDETLAQSFPLPALVAPDYESAMSGLADSAYSCFYCHGYFDEESPDESGLVLPDQTTLTAATVRNTPMMSNRLTFLASCESGMIKTRRLPNEFIGLPVSFLEAGLDCVCSSLWLTHVEVAQYAAERFFSLTLLDGISPAHAMRQMALEVAGLADDTPDNLCLGLEFSTAAFWGCFVVTGGFDCTATSWGRIGIE